MILVFFEKKFFCFCSDPLGYFCVFFQKILIFIYLFDCARDQLQHMGSLFSCSRWDLVSRPGMQPRPPALGGWSLVTGPPGKCHNHPLQTSLPVFSWSIHSAANDIISFFLWPSNIPLCICNTSSFSIPLLMDIQNASTSWLL